MPGKKHLRGVGDKEQRQYEHIDHDESETGVAEQQPSRRGPSRRSPSLRTATSDRRRRGRRAGRSHWPAPPTTEMTAGRAELVETSMMVAAADQFPAFSAASNASANSFCVNGFAIR